MLWTTITYSAVRSFAGYRARRAGSRLRRATTRECASVRSGGDVVTRGRRGEQWRAEREPRGDRVRAIRPDGVATPWRSTLLVRATPGVVSVGTRRYRGDLLVAPHGDSLVIVNRLPLEDYLRGVVAVEMGSRSAQDSSAVQAQAVAARSYAVLRLEVRGRPFDVYGSVMDQAYGGLDAENAGAVAA